MKLTDEQLNEISNRIRKAGIHNKSLQEDLIDHLCCVAEQSYKKGEDFNRFLDRAIMELAPHGLLSLQKKTTFLLNYAKLTFMKRLLFTSGFVGAVSLTLGVTFKLLYFPGANVLSVLGLILLLLFFVPLYSFKQFKVRVGKTNLQKLQLVFGGVASVLIGLSAVFKMFHLMGADVLLLLGTLLFAFGFLPFLFVSLYKKSFG